ncbi:hypothetical protein [Brevibacillus brevis]|uniref:hypothetical protein n=1 Tax=Brevibacillus brevis TaxID=1393 RepID=UPI001EDBFA58|nr:hypothetical protein [Brevibacillus brevis]UKK97618.1 hypothetical protein FO446_09390 [Brevibacillus brevis]
MESMEKRFESLLKELNFEKVLINNTVVFSRDGMYCKLTFIQMLESYVIEYAYSYDQAQKNLFEDGDLFSMFLDVEN